VCASATAAAHAGSALATKRAASARAPPARTGRSADCVRYTHMSHRNPCRMQYSEAYMLLHGVCSAARCMPRTCRSAGARDSSSAAAELASMTPPYSAKKTNVPAHAPRLPRADASDASRRDASERVCALSRSRRRQSQGSCELGLGADAAWPRAAGVPGVGCSDGHSRRCSIQATSMRRDDDATMQQRAKAGMAAVLCQPDQLCSSEPRIGASSGAALRLRAT
jgi:hypothetical protein